MTARQEARNELLVFHDQWATREVDITSVLPPQLRDRFKRVVKTAVSLNPRLLTECDRMSLFTAAQRAATDGLLPDGREGALVPYKGKVQWLPMVAGLRKKVRLSGEIATWEVEVVHEGDEFDYQLGDRPFIAHKPALVDRGSVIGAYSIATYKTGEVSRDFMTLEEILRRRDVSRTQREDSPWNTWFDEMCRKTVAKHHSKVLPMSTDLDEFMARFEDEDEDGENRPAPRPRPASLGERLRMVSAPREEGQQAEQQQEEAKPQEPKAQVAPEPQGQALKQEATQEKPAESKPASEAAKAPGEADPKLSRQYEAGARAAREGFALKAVLPLDLSADEATAFRQGFAAVRSDG